MPESLYSVMLPLVEKSETGALHIEHESGDNGIIGLEHGQIAGAEYRDLKGMDAAKKIAMWVHFDAVFSSRIIDMENHLLRIGTNRFLAFLIKISERIEKIKKIIPSSAFTIRLLPDRMTGKKTFDPIELEIATLLDGQRTISEIVSSANQPELHTLIHIFNFHTHGLIEIKSAKKCMPNEERNAFLDGLRATLADLLGPASEVVIQEAFDRTRLNARHLSKNDIPELIDVIAGFLDPDDKTIFNNWAVKHLIKRH